MAKMVNSIYMYFTTIFKKDIIDKIKWKKFNETGEQNWSEN